jgi:hypothetical protein
MIATRGLPPGRVTLVVVAHQNSTNGRVLLPSMRHRFGFDGGLFGKTILLPLPTNRRRTGHCHISTVGVSTVCGLDLQLTPVQLRPRHTVEAPTSLHPSKSAKERGTVWDVPAFHVGPTEDGRGNGRRAPVALLREPCGHTFGPSMILFQTFHASLARREQDLPEKAESHVSARLEFHWRLARLAGGSHGPRVDYQATPAWRGSAKNHGAF